MAVVIRPFNNCVKKKLYQYKFVKRNIYITYVPFSESQETEEKSDAYDILSEFKESELSEEEILKKRFKARLPERVYRIFMQKEAVPIEAKYDFDLLRLRQYYARHGKDSKLNPGICWPTREEILETVEYDKVLEPPLEVRMKNIETARLAEEKRKREVEEEVEKNMANLDKWIAEYHAKIEKKKSEALQLKKKREQLVEEISEYLGYDIDPKDPRFQEAVEQKEKEKKKEAKAKKQQESYDKMIAKLKKMAES